MAVVLLRPQRIYEYPYFIAATFAIFLLPQAYSIYQNEWGGIYAQTTFLMASLCIVAAWAGYQARPHPRLLEKLNVPVNRARFFAGGIMLVVIGAYFTYKFSTLPEEEVSSQLTGIGTIYLFFGGLVYPGFAVCFYSGLKGMGMTAWVISGLAAIIPFQAAVYYGRREPTALFLSSLGLSLYFVKGFKPMRLIIVAVMVGAALLIPATSEYRSLAKDDPWAALAEIDFRQQFQSSMEEDVPSELKNATALIAATHATGSYQLGADYWNSLIFRFVPAQFVGKELKDALMIGGVHREFGDYVEQTLGFALPTGMTVTGIGDSFNQFGYFGCLFFAALGYLFKSLWAAADQRGGAIAQILYIQSVTSAMRAVTHQTIDFLPGFVYSAIFIGAIAWFAKERTILQPVHSAEPVLPLPR